jgi:hypothetical protein
MTPRGFFRLPVKSRKLHARIHGGPKTYVERSNAVQDPAVSPAHPQGRPLGPYGSQPAAGDQDNAYRNWNDTRAGKNIKYITTSEASPAFPRDEAV